LNDARKVDFENHSAFLLSKKKTRYGFGGAESDSEDELDSAEDGEKKAPQEASYLDEGRVLSWTRTNIGVE
jgi:hypothetical protein